MNFFYTIILCFVLIQIIIWTDPIKCDVDITINEEAEEEGRTQELQRTKIKSTCKSRGFPLSWTSGQIKLRPASKYFGYNNELVKSKGTQDPNSLTQIDLFVLYTSDVPNQFKITEHNNIEKTVKEEIQQMVHHINKIFSLSKVYIILNLIWTKQVNYKPKQKIDQDLMALTLGEEKSLYGIHKLRNCLGADMVTLLTTYDDKNKINNDTLGASWTWTHDNSLEIFAEHGPFSVIRIFPYEELSPWERTMTIARTWAHEIGHNFGCNHQKELLSDTEIARLMYPYAMGYEFISLDRQQTTIMALSSNLSTRIDLFSNPDIVYLGTEAGNKNDANCAKVLNTNAEKVASFRTQPDVDECPSHLLGCDKILFSTQKLDICGICGGNNLSCVDCSGVLFGNKTKDCKGLCGGETVLDCKGICGGSSKLDLCGVCEGTNLCFDCNGVKNGKSVRDCKGRCGGSAKLDCKGICDGFAVVDCNGTCGGNVTLDCNGICGGPSVRDCSGICNGNKITDCKGICGGSSKIDCTGTCDGQTVIDCEGICGGGKLLDRCGVCGGDSSCLDCMGIRMGNSTLDCKGICNGPHIENECGYCINPFVDVKEIISSLENQVLWKDCQGQCGGSALVDSCGVCSGGTTGHVFDSDKDSCGTCFGDNSKCDCECFLPLNYYQTHHCFSSYPEWKVTWPRPYQNCSDTLCGNDHIRWIDILLSRSIDPWTLLAQQWIVMQLNANLYLCYDDSTNDEQIKSTDSTLTNIDEFQFFSNSAKDMIDKYCEKELPEEEASFAITLTEVMRHFNERSVAFTKECVIKETEYTLEYPTDLCSQGCVMYPHYWTSFYSTAENPKMRKPWPVDPKSIVGNIESESYVLCNKTWLSIVLYDQDNKENPSLTEWMELAKIWIFTQLNIYSGACITLEVENIIKDTEKYLLQGCSKTKTQNNEKTNGNYQSKAIPLDNYLYFKNILEQYNLGLLGPDLCGSYKSEGEKCQMISTGNTDYHILPYCVRDPNFWMMHHNNENLPGVKYPWPNSPEDLNSDGIFNDPAEMTVLCGITWSEIMQLPVDSIWVYSARHYISSQLNIQNGVCAPDIVISSIDHMKTLLEASCQNRGGIGTGSKNGGYKKQFEKNVDILQMYNAGTMGPLVCLESVDFDMIDLINFGLHAMQKLKPTNEFVQFIAFDQILKDESDGGGSSSGSDSTESTEDLDDGGDGDGAKANGYLAWAIVMTILLPVVILGFVVFLCIRMTRTRMKRR